MKNSQGANNTLYFKAFNSDYHIDGKYYSLSLIDFKCIVALQSYANAHGEICDVSGNAYSHKVLSKMIGIDDRAVRKAIQSLSDNNMIRLSDNNAIEIVGFVHDNVYRDSNNSKATRGRVMIAKQVAENKKSLERIEYKVDDISSDTWEVFDKQTGNIRKARLVNNIVTT